MCKKLLGIILVLCLAGIANAAIVTSFESSEGYTLGTIEGQPTTITSDGPDWTTKWYSDGSTNLSVISGGAPGGGSQHMQGTTDYIRREFEEFTEGLCIVSMKVRLDDATSPWDIGEARFQLEETGGLDAIDFSIFNSANWARIRSSAGEQNLDPAVDFPTNTWFDLVLSMNIDSDMQKIEYSTTLGGALNTLGTGWYAFESAVTNIGRITVNGAGGAGGAVNWDDINIVPEPATIMLLGLGGLALIRKKR